jgi:hypothetical protein
MRTLPLLWSYILSAPNFVFPIMLAECTLVPFKARVSTFWLFSPRLQFRIPLICLRSRKRLPQIAPSASREALVEAGPSVH